LGIIDDASEVVSCWRVLSSKDHVVEVVGRGFEAAAANFLPRR
jgi:hypothetical protein